MITADQQAAWDLLTLANNIEPMHWFRNDSLGTVVGLPAVWEWTQEWTTKDNECPLTHAARVLLGESYSCYEWEEAARALGIPKSVGHVIVYAADNPLYAPSEHRDALRSCYALSADAR